MPPFSFLLSLIISCRSVCVRGGGDDGAFFYLFCLYLHGSEEQVSGAGFAAQQRLRQRKRPIPGQLAFS